MAIHFNLTTGNIHQRNEHLSYAKFQKFSKLVEQVGGSNNKCTVNSIFDLKFQDTIIHFEIISKTHIGVLLRERTIS